MNARSDKPRAVLEGISVGFVGENGRWMPVLEEVDVTFPNDRIIGLIGRNGTGKTTLLEVIAGTLEPSKGTVNRASTPGVVAYMPQRSMALPWLSVAGNIRLVSDSVLRSGGHCRLVSEVLSVFRLDEAQRKFPHELSGGFLQMLSLAMGFIIDAELYLIDETMSALDADRAQSIKDFAWRAIRETKATGIFVSHDLGDVVSMCDEVVMVRRNRRGPLDRLELPEELQSMEPSARLEHSAFSAAVQRVSAALFSDSR